MGAASKIEWTDASWNPIRARRRVIVENDGGTRTATGSEPSVAKTGWHCEHVSEGCRNCYAETMNKRLGTGLDFKPGHRAEIELFLDETMLLQPLKWRKPRMIFVGSMTDLFADFVTDEWIDRIFAVMALCPWHTFQVLSKRSARMREYLTARNGMGSGSICHAINAIPAHMGDRHGALEMPLPNVWAGVSCEDQATADARLDDLDATPAAKRFVSYEPALGPLNLRKWLRLTPNNEPLFFNPPRHHFDWIIAGGESGRRARPMHPDWVRSIRDQCAAAGVPFFFKQWGGWLPYRQWADSERAGNALFRKDWMVLNRIGGLQIPDDQCPDEAEGECAVLKTGKKRAGRLLDGVEHNGMPASPGGA